MNDEVIRVLIAGANSYIGNNIKKWLTDGNQRYVVDEVDMIDEGWRNRDFSNINVIIHVAGIVHIKENASLEKLYERVNTTLPIEVANKAKAAGVEHFIFLSTKGVYKPNTKYIDKNTLTMPTRLYGKSKLRAEEGILKLASDTFHVSILRPPTVYGEGCKGNFPKVEAFSYAHHVFPRIFNKRSMIYIWNLCEYIKRIIDKPLANGQILFPQNQEFKGTLDLLIGLWKERNEKFYLSPSAALFVKLIMLLPRTDKIKTVFLDTVYSREISDDFNFEYCVFSFEESIRRIVEAERRAC